MPLLPISVGFSKPATADKFSIVRHLIADRPLSYTLDPDLDYTEVVNKGDAVRIAFPKLGTVIVQANGDVTTIPAFATDQRDDDAAVIYAADGYAVGFISRTAMLFVNNALTLALIRYAYQGPEPIRARLADYLFAGPPDHFCNHLKEHYTLHHQTPKGD